MCTRRGEQEHVVRSERTTWGDHICEPFTRENDEANRMCKGREGVSKTPRLQMGLTDSHLA